MESDQPAPFVKWAGGKAQLLGAYDELFPQLATGAAYHEPFVGGGAVFFHLASTGRLTGEVHLSDCNEDLVSTWLAVRDQPKKLARRLGELAAKHSTEHYYALRDRYNDMILPPLERAALFLYLNKAGFNGLYRVNAAGKFNVPCGRQESGPSFPGRAFLLACSELLRGVEARCEPFTQVLERAEKGDFVYFDPPYVPLSVTASFTAYTEGGFGPAEQESLRDVFAKLARRGCRVMLSNSGTPVVRELYRDFHVTPVSARRAINSKKTARGPVTEVVVRSWS